MAIEQIRGVVVDVESRKVEPWSGRHPMFIERSGSVIQDRVLRSKVLSIGAEPHVDMLGPDRDDATVVTGCSDLGRWLIGDRRERQQVRLTGR